MSQIKVHRDIVEKAAKILKDSILEKRQKIFQKHVDEVKNHWWSKLFRKNWTQEDFESYVQSQNDIVWRYIYGRQKSLCQELLSMCELSDDGFVYLDREGAELVNYWRDK